MKNVFLQPPDGFLNEEVRCGFTVPTKLKKIWAIELDLLNEFDKVCRKHNISYSVWAGTLLGAVRHQGFIPWDDDFDVCLTRENYNKLLTYADEFKHPYFLQHALNDRKFFFGYARLRNSETTGIIAWNKSPDYNNGIYIDVYVLDGVPKSDLLLKFKIWSMQFVNRFIDLYNRDNLPKSAFKKILFKPCKYLIRMLFSYEKLKKIYDSIISFFNDGNVFGLVTHGYKIALQYNAHKEDFNDMERVKYEYIDIPVPKNRNAILTHIYGDYMQFPPAEERGKWHENIIIFDPDISYKEYFARHKE